MLPELRADAPPWSGRPGSTSPGPRPRLPSPAKPGFAESGKSPGGKSPGKAEKSPGKAKPQTSLAQNPSAQLAAAALVLVIVTAVITSSLAGGDVEAVLPPTMSEPGAYTKHYVQQAVALHASNIQDGGGGRGATVAHYLDRAAKPGDDRPEDDWYLFIIDPETGMVEADTAFPHRVGDDATQLVDVNGHAYGPELVEAPAEGAWASYVDVRPTTGKGGMKHAWVVRRGGLVFGSGWYEASYERKQETTEREPGAYTRALVEEAVWLYEAEGLDALTERHNSPNSIEGSRYVIVFDSDGKLLAHPQSPEHRGESLRGPLGIDAADQDFGSEMLAADEAGKWVPYEGRNPVTGEIENMYAWVVRRGGIFIGSSWTGG